MTEVFNRVYTEDVGKSYNLLDLMNKFKGIS